MSYERFVEISGIIDIKWVSDDPDYYVAPIDLFDEQVKGIPQWYGKKDKATTEQAYFTCNPCDCDLKGVNTLREHCKGKPHIRKALQKKLELNNARKKEVESCDRSQIFAESMEVKIRPLIAKLPTMRKYEGDSSEEESKFDREEAEYRNLCRVLQRRLARKDLPMKIVDGMRVERKHTSRSTSGSDTDKEEKEAFERKVNKEKAKKDASEKKVKKAEMLQRIEAKREEFRKLWYGYENLDSGPQWEPNFNPVLPVYAAKNEHEEETTSDEEETENGSDTEEEDGYNAMRACSLGRVLLRCKENKN